MSVPFKKVSSFGELLQTKADGDGVAGQSNSHATPTHKMPTAATSAADLGSTNDGIIRRGSVPSQPAVQQLIKDRNIRGLVHFTPMQNVPSILERGLMPRAQLEQLRARGEVQFTYSDHRRFDGKESNCLSIAFPNGEMFYRKRREHGWPTRWVVLVFHPEEILNHPSTVFTVSNASRGGVGRFHGAEGLRRIYGDSPPHWHCPPDRQAEVRVPHIIDTDLINVICCETDEDVAEVRDLAARARCGTGTDGLWCGSVKLGKSYFTNPVPPRYSDCPYS